MAQNKIDKSVQLDTTGKPYFQIICWIVILVGVVFHLYRITANEFFFYDEGMYLNYNRNFLTLLEKNPPQNLNEFWVISKILFGQALSTAKALWFGVVNLRVLFGGIEMWYFPRVISAVSGIATLFVTYLLACNLFQSKKIGLVSAALLCVLPSHIFYSRLAMQEGLSALFFILSIYFYLIPHKFSYRTFISVIFMAALFFCNYRMIIAPVFIVFSELFLSWSARQIISWRKLVWFCVTFYAIVFGLGSLFNGANTFITFAWMFHQADMAKSDFDVINFLSFPYYLFRLEHFLWGLLFFSGFIFWVVKKEWKKLYPFCIVLLQMLIFSFASEKGARYLSVVLSFEAIAIGAWLVIACEHFFKKRKEIILCGAVLLLSACLMWQSKKIVQFRSDYGHSVQFVKSVDNKAKFLSTQPLVHALYLEEKEVVDCPKSIESLLAKYAQGYQYLILDSQAYVSWTSDTKRFTPELINFIEFIRQKVPPIKVFPHANQFMLSRFVFDHNENLSRSIRFLNQKNQHYGSIYVYDLRVVINIFKEALGKDIKI